MLRQPNYFKRQIHTKVKYGIPILSVNQLSSVTVSVCRRVWAHSVDYHLGCVTSDKMNVRLSSSMHYAGVAKHVGLLARGYRNGKHQRLALLATSVMLGTCRKEQASKLWAPPYLCCGSVGIIGLTHLMCGVWLCKSLRVYLTCDGPSECPYAVAIV